MSKRPKDMTNEELMALPEIPMFTQDVFILDATDILNGFIMHAGKRVLLCNDSVVGDQFNIPHVVKLVAEGFEHDDILMWSDYRGDSWVPVQHAYGQWGKRRFL